MAALLVSKEVSLGAGAARYPLHRPEQGLL
jgi:hypothetical protein